MGGGRYQPNSPKLDEQATDGLLGVKDSAAYRIHEIERHIHTRTRFYGKKGSQTATDWAEDTLTAFQAISGSNTYGAQGTDGIDDAALVIGTDNTPIITGMVKYDLHELFITSVSVNTRYKLRLVYGSGTIGAAIIDEQCSEVIIIADKDSPQSAAGGPVEIHMPRLSAGVDKVWAQVWNVTDNATVDFLVGIHEYEG